MRPAIFFFNALMFYLLLPLGAARAGEPGVPFPGAAEELWPTTGWPGAPDWPHDWDDDIPVGEPIGRVTACHGLVHRIPWGNPSNESDPPGGNGGEAEPIPLSAGDAIHTAETIETGPDGAWEAVAGTSIRLRLGPDGRLDILRRPRFPEGGTRLDLVLAKGTLRVRLAANTLATDRVALRFHEVEMASRRGDWIAAPPAAPAADGGRPNEENPSDSPGPRVIVLSGAVAMRELPVHAPAGFEAAPSGVWLVEAGEEARLANEGFDGHAGPIRQRLSPRQLETIRAEQSFAAERERAELPRMPNYGVGANPPEGDAP